MTSSDADAESQQITFPIQSLYPEIISQIFTFCLPESFDHLQEAMHATLTLCNVCSSWRVLAIATPPLWTRFHLEINCQSLRRFGIDSIVERIHTWLGRSGTHPLKICFFCTPELGLVQACEAIAMYTSRWETVKINIPPHSWPNISEAPRLHTLHVYNRLEDVPFTFAPRLTNLALLSLAFHDPWPDITNVPWHQLTNVVLLRHIADIKVLDIIRHCTRLESLCGMIDLERDHMDIPQIEHATLQVLDLYAPDHCHAFLESLILPALSRLTLAADGRWSHCSELVDLFNRSHCELDHLAVVDCISTSDELLQLLKQKSCRTLTSLVIMKWRNNWLPSPINDCVITQMTLADDDGGMVAGTTPLCPNLAELTLHAWGSDYTSPGVLGRMILSRCSKGRPLSVFNFAKTYCIAEEDIALLKLAEENGLRRFEVAQYEVA